MTTPLLLDTAALLALVRREDVTWADVAGEVDRCGSASELLARRVSSDADLFNVPSADREVDEALADIRRWHEEGTSTLAFFDPKYPSRLRDVHQMPPLVFTRGTPPPHDRAIAVVGTRRASDRGIKIARAVANELVKNDVTVVSGLAEGIDTAAHSAALEAKGWTTAIIGTGVGQYYPAKNRALQERIEREGYLLSQFLPGSPPTKKTFPMRNAVMSGYSAATVVIEAAWKSGARMQARLALQHGRPVVFPKELLEHDWARKYAEYPSVTVVKSTEELLEAVTRIIAEPVELSKAFEGLPSLA